MVFNKYNDYERNPYSDFNDDGQKIIRELGIKHTSMSIGDIIKVRGDFFIVLSHSFTNVVFEENYPYSLEQNEAVKE